MINKVIANDNLYGRNKEKGGNLNKAKRIEILISESMIMSESHVTAYEA